MIKNLNAGVHYTGMRNWINNNLNFTKSEFNGILALFVLLVLITAVPRIYEWSFPRKLAVQEMVDLDKLELEGSLKALAPVYLGEHKMDKSKRKPKGLRQILKIPFDPNTLDQHGWEMRGLTARQAMAVLNYRTKGGMFRKVEDLKKMYTISPEVYQALSPYVKISNLGADTHQANTEKITYKPKESKVYELNGLDTNSLQLIYGVGPAFARRIYKYRLRLGGFYKAEQLLEIYGIDSLKYQELLPQVRINAALVQKININEVDFDRLKLHPYLSYKQANAIIAYRKQHGNYSSFAALKNVAILPAETVEKLIPYLSF